MWRKREIQKIMTKNEALQKALDALGPTPPDCCGCQTEWQIAIDVIKEALAQPEQEPVAWEGGEGWESLAWELCADENGEDSCNELIWEGGPIPEPWGDRWMKYEEEAKRLIALVQKHTTPPQRTWVGLTDEEIKSIWLNEKDYGDDWLDVQGIARAIETKLRSKND